LPSVNFLLVAISANPQLRETTFQFHRLKTGTEPKVYGTRTEYEPTILTFCPSLLWTVSS